jgi:epoxyqueuosine reductase QueG
MNNENLKRAVENYRKQVEINKELALLNAELESALSETTGALDEAVQTIAHAQRGHRSIMRNALVALGHARAYYSNPTEE